MNQPLLSICIPAYRAERFLPETLASIRRQTHSDWEVVLVEDGSQDGTERVLLAFAASGTQRVRYVRHSVNRGLPATRNTAIELAQGEWVALLDSDDLWEPTHLAELVACTQEHSDADLVYAGSRLFDSDTGAERGIRAPSDRDLLEFPRSLFVGSFLIQPSSVMLRKSLWTRAGGFDPAFRYVEDLDMWLRCARAGARFAYTGGATCRYRKHPAALSTHSAQMAEAVAAVFAKHLDWESIPPDVRVRQAADAWASAGRLRQRADPAVGADHFRRACAIQWSLDWWLRGHALALMSALAAARPGRPG